MGFQEKNDCGTTVTATLTNVGKLLLLTDPTQFDVSHFIPRDTGIDYTLFNDEHPDGDLYYDTAIVNLTNIEPHGDAIVHDLGSALIRNLPPDIVNLPVIRTVPDFPSPGLDLDKLGEYKDIALEYDYLDTTNLQIKVTVMNPQLVDVQVISNHTVQGRQHGSILSREITSSLLTQHIKPAEFYTHAQAHMRITAKYNDVGTTGDYLSTQVIIQEQASDIEYRLPVNVKYNREIDLGDTAKAGSQ